MLAEEIFTLSATLVLIWVLSKLTPKFKTSHPIDTTVKKIKANELHGHRCFIEDLTNYEQRLVKHLSKNLDPHKYYLFNNVTVPSSNTITTQIDHIVVSKYGIFVIENKDFAGWIFGRKNQKNWTQVFKGGKKSHFQNPILQNFAHIIALKEQMPFLKKSFYNVIVFSEKCEFKTEMSAHVMHGQDLVEYITSKKNEILSEGELLMAIGKLSVLCQTIQISNTEHIENLVISHKQHSESLAFKKIDHRNSCHTESGTP